MISVLTHLYINIMVYKSLDPKKQNKVKENIKAYEDFKTLFTMTKPKSPCTVVFCIDSDDFLIYVIKYKTKSGGISESSIVLRPDIPRWTQIYEQEGFTKI